MRTFILLNILFFTCLFGSISAQDYTVHVQNIGIEDGLLHRDVQAVFEDKNSFIWIGGIKGLQRYDGHDFKSWTKIDKSGLIYYITSIGQDDAGWLWLWNNDLLKFVFLHPESEEILTVEERFGADFPLRTHDYINGTWANSKSRIPTNRKGQLLFGTKEGQIITYDSHNGFQTYQTDLKIPLNIELIDNQDNLWVYSYQKGYFKINMQGQVLLDFEYEADVNLNILSDWKKKEIYFHKIFLTADGYSKSGKTFKVNETGELQFINNSFSNSFPFKGNFWVNDRKVGWKIYAKDSKELLYVLKKEDYPLSLFESIHSPYHDSRGNYWIFGSLGINKVKFQKSLFNKYFSFERDIDKPFPNSVRGLWVDKDTIFANFEKGLTLRINAQEPKDWQILSNKQWARPMLKEQSGNFLIGYPFSISSINSFGKVFNEYNSEEKEFSGIWSLYKTKAGKLWIGSGEKLVYKDKETTKLQLYAPSEDPFGFTKRRGAIQNMIPEADGLVWFCSWTGLYLFDTKTEKILARYASDEEGEFFLPANLFYYIYKDLKGVYWIGTNEGLIRWIPNSLPNLNTTHKNESTIRLFTRKDGLSNDVIYAIFEDQHNKLWMSSDYGIMSFDKTTFDVKSYLEKDGIAHHEFNRTSQFQTADGTIYFGGLNGITAFHPDDFVEKETDYAKMLITDFEIFDGKERKLINKTGELLSTKTINFHPEDRFFRIKFALPTFEDINHILYAWKVKGVDTDWNYQKENSLQIGTLPYGSHILRIKGQSAAGGWSPYELAIQVNILKPFYLQIWFILLSLLAVLLGAYLFYKRRTRLLKETQKLLETEIEKATSKIEAQAEELREMDKVKTRFFANVSHELRTPITLIQGPIQSALKSQQLNNRNFTLLYKAKENTKKLLQLVNEILDLTKLDAHKLELDESTVVLYTFLKRIISNFESYAASKSLELVFTYAPIPELQVKVDTNKLERILSNLLTNAFKFTPNNGEIAIAVKDLGKDLLLTVKDTGRGIPDKDIPHIFNRFYQSSKNEKAEGGLGIGLALSMEYVKLMNGRMWVESSTQPSLHGSTFYVQFPKKEVIAMLSNENALALKELSNPKSAPNLPSKKEAPTSKEYSILLVEDNPDLREYISFLLSPHYHVFMAENGEEAMNLLQNQSPQHFPKLIVSDIMMPIMDGYEFLEKLKEQDEFRHIPIIMLTARAELKDRLKALRIGVDDYLLKPFDEEELLTRIDNLLQNYQERLTEATAFSPESNGETTSQKKEDVATTKALLMTKEDQVWLENLEVILNKNLSNTQYSISQLADDMVISERQLRRRIKQLTGLTTLHYFKEIRLQKARQLLETRQYKTIAQTANAVGFPNTKTFSRNFSHRFGKMPSEHLTN